MHLSRTAFCSFDFALIASPSFFHFARRRVMHCSVVVIGSKVAYYSHKALPNASVTFHSNTILSVLGDMLFWCCEEAHCIRSFWCDNIPMGTYCFGRSVKAFWHNEEALVEVLWKCSHLTEKKLFFFLCPLSVCSVHHLKDLVIYIAVGQGGILLFYANEKSLSSITTGRLCKMLYPNTTKN